MAGFHTTGAAHGKTCAATRFSYCYSITLEITVEIAKFCIAASSTNIRNNHIGPFILYNNVLAIAGDIGSNLFAIAITPVIHR